jgi:hypothetical protein
MAADNLIDTAIPPASSTAELIRDPLDSRFRLFCRFAFVLSKLYAAKLDAVFVLILIILYSFTFTCGFRAALGPIFVVLDLTFPDFPGKLFLFHLTHC